MYDIRCYMQTATTTAGLRHVHACSNLHHGVELLNRGVQRLAATCVPIALAYTLTVSTQRC